ncbi:MAG TPA: hypothetical protein VKR61_10955 [Bryobacteraceae bacterium]|nr:hypothetical protein [Bryobacteraceae bacterium]
MLTIAITVMAICCFAMSAAAATAPIITYTASGTFSGSPSTGADTLKLSGEPFTVTIAVSAATVPYKTGPGYAAYNKLKLTGTVHSGLIGSTPVPISSGEATIIQGITPNVSDTFIMEAPIKVVGISLVIKAMVTMPLGTITKPLLHPFSAVTLTPANATVTYSNSSDSTTLGIQTGTLTATIP